MDQSRIARAHRQLDFFKEKFDTARKSIEDNNEIVRLSSWYMKIRSIEKYIEDLEQENLELELIIKSNIE